MLSDRITRRSSSKYHNNQKTVLLVEDDPELNETIQAILKAHDYNVESSGSGQEALNLLKNIEQPDLILIDYIMPRMSGPEFLKAMQLEFPKISSVPAAYVTGNVEAESQSELAVITKPFTIENFLKKIASLLSCKLQG